jgi:hypothetical protein
MDEADLPAAIERANRLSQQHKWMVMQALGGRWAELDPRSAATYAAGERTSRRNGLLQSVLNSWAGKDPDAALGFATTLPASEDRVNILVNIITPIAIRDPAKALQLLAATPGETWRFGGYDRVFVEWAHQDPARAAAAALELPRGNGRAQAL